MTEHGAAHAPSIGALFWPAVNFVLFVILLARVLAGPLREYFRERTASLRGALEAGARARAEAAALKAALLRDIENLPAVKSQLRNDLRLTAERECADMLSQARQAASRIRNDARLLAEYEFAGARQTLRAEVIDETIREATAMVRDSLRPEDQARFVREFVSGAGAAA
jgi:F-type H+-transporting ATPase subunit b